VAELRSYALAAQSGNHATVQLPNFETEMSILTHFTGIANVHLITGARGVVVVDAGMPHQARWILAKVRALGYSPGDVRLILVTHGHIDHAGSAVALRRLTGAPIALHRADAPLVAARHWRIPPARNARVEVGARIVERLGRLVPLETFAPDLWLDDSLSLSEFGIDGQIVHTPGHTHGSVSVALADGCVLVGDAILNLVRVSFPLVWEDAAAARESACRIQSLRPKRVYTGHGRTFSRVQLDAFVEKVKRSSFVSSAAE
jgi:glyoxylase-like metal-dependent hydrolase (beta-lactamase superfamily II)